MTQAPTRLIVENLAEKRFAEALLRPYRLRIDDALTTSGAVALAELSLLEHPEQPVALLLNAGTEEPERIEELRATVKRILARAAPEGWFVALAIPRLNAWAVTDPRIRRAFEEEEATRSDYFNQAVRIGPLTTRQPFDATALRQANEDFRGLLRFLEIHQPNHHETS